MDPVQRLIDEGDTEALLEVLAQSPELAEARNEDGRTIAQLIIASKQTAMLAAVLERYPVDLDNQDDAGWSALHQAASAGLLSVVEMVLPHGARLQTRGGQTALHYAAGKGHIAIVNALLPHVDVRTCDALGQTALHRAATLGQTQAISALLGHEHGIVDWRDAQGNTALNLASQEGHEAAIRVLLELGADKSIPNNDGQRASV